jgi:TPR repeat protein
MEQSLEEKKKLQWQTERAEKGSDPAQFALGMRYLEGKGVEKDLKKARKWLEASAKQGNAEAKKALAEHPELPPLDDKAPATPATSAKP